MKLSSEKDLARTFIRDFRGSGNKLAIDPITFRSLGRRAAKLVAGLAGNIFLYNFLINSNVFFNKQSSEGDYISPRRFDHSSIQICGGFLSYRIFCRRHHYFGHWGHAICTAITFTILFAQTNSLKNHIHNKRFHKRDHSGSLQWSIYSNGHNPLIRSHGDITISHSVPWCHYTCLSHTKIQSAAISFADHTVAGMVCYFFLQHYQSQI